MAAFDSDPGGRAAIRLSLPPHPSVPPTSGFPWIAMLAPIAGSLALWLITGSAMALAFAALGPIVALGSVFDGRRQARRARRLGAAERAERLEELHAAIAERHRVERSGAWRATPSTRRRLTAEAPLDWRNGEPAPIVLGSGPVPSALSIDGQPIDDDDRAVLERAGCLDDAPVLCAVAGGIGLVGPPPLARAAARAILLQLAHHCRPGLLELRVPATPEWAWSLHLPHVAGAGDRAVRLIDGTSGHASGSTEQGVASIAVAATVEELPASIDTVVVVETPRRALVEIRGTGAEGRAVVPELLGASEAAVSALRLRDAAVRERIGSAVAALPRRVALAELVQPPAGLARNSLRAVVGATATGPLEIDLVAGGPHAIVAGTTGSGKSEFLLAWIGALASAYPPQRVAFLLVDFKGGAAFEPVRDLPHVTGIVTDLDENEAERAVLSLRAELRHRESVLLVERLRDIAELPEDIDLARLVIVVDEFQAMIERFPDLGAVIADIAARGRSLGVHLVLASQRPNGVVREQVTANCPIRVSLRVMQPADSTAVVGTDAAARIGPQFPGRGVADVGNGSVVEFQSAQLDGTALDAIRSASRGLPRARRPWVDPLPARVLPRMLEPYAATASEAAVDALAIGLLDVPDRQRHELAVWSPSCDGHLLVLGAPGSGRSTVLAAVARAASERSVPLHRIDGPMSAQWDALHALLSGLRRGESSGVLLVDDLDVRFREWPDEYRHAALGVLDSILREGRGRGLVVAAAAGSGHRLPASMGEAFGERALLRHPSRGELVHAGGTGELWRPREAAGAGQWRGHRVQFVDAGRLPGAPDAGSLEPLLLGASDVWAIVARSVRATADAVRAAGVTPIVLEPAGDSSARDALLARDPHSAVPLVIVGDADAWTGNWAVAAAARDVATVVVRGGHRELRVFHAPGGSLPPLIDDLAVQCWLLTPSGAIQRVGWPPVLATENDGAGRF